MKQVNIYEARNRLSQLVKDAASGEEIVIANRGEPVARLVGIPANKPRLGHGPSIVKYLIENPIPDHLRRSKEEIELAIAEERDAWD